MSTLNAELYDALKSAGAPDREARAAAESVADGRETATKTDLAKLKSELIIWFVGVAIASGIVDKFL